MPVRAGRHDDLPTLRRLQELLSDPTPELFAATRPDQIRVSDDDRNRPVGYLLPIHGEEVHIAEAVVHPDHRREGRATALFQSVLDAAETRVTLLVAADNEAAISLYRKLGFETVERRPDAYADGAGLFMAWEEAE